MIDLFDGAIDLKRLHNVLFHQLEAPLVLEVLDIATIARDEAVHADDLVSLGQKEIGQMRPDEPGRAGDEDSHCSVSLAFTPVRIEHRRPGVSYPVPAALDPPPAAATFLNP